MLSKEAISASKYYILIDLDDQDNYKHPLVSAVKIQKLIVEAEKASDGQFDVWVGVLRENDGTDGSVDWFQPMHIEAVGNPTDSTDRYTRTFDYTDERDLEGIDCSISGGRLNRFKSDANSGNKIELRTDAGNLDNAAGGTAKSASVGDVVVWVEMTGGTGTIDLALTCKYSTE
jgi:hypothetical protein